MPTISLRDAFSVVLHTIEVADNVPPPDRCGRPRPTSRVEPHSRYFATGSQFVAKFGHATPSEEEEDGTVISPGSPRRCRIPNIPTDAHLELLMADHRQDFKQTTPWEQRLCLAHLWLVQAIELGWLKVIADLTFIPEDGSDQGERSGVTWKPGDLTDGKFNHFNSRITLINRQHRVSGTQCRGEIWLSHVRIDADAGRIAALYQQARLVKVILRVEENEDHFIINWGGERIRHDKSGLSGVLLRGIHSIAILTRDGIGPIPCYLLAGIETDNRDTRPNDHGGDDGQHKFKLFKEFMDDIKCVCDDLKGGLIDGNEARTRLSHPLNENCFQGQRPRSDGKSHAEAWLHEIQSMAAQTRAARGRKPRATAPYRADNVQEMVIAAIKVALWGDTPGTPPRGLHQDAGIHVAHGAAWFSGYAVLKSGTSADGH